MVVSNSSPLVYLAALGDFDLLRVLFDEITIPPTVFQEVAIAGARFPVSPAVLAARDKWIHVRGVRDPTLADHFRSAGLHPGESEALALAVEIQPDALLMDDQEAVHRAVSLGVNVIRTPGVYRLAKQRGLLPAVAPKLEDLRRAGFWLRDDHFSTILRSVGEL